MKYRKRPVVIEARQVSTHDYDGLCEIVAWCGGTVSWMADDEEHHLFTIDTLEGTMYVNAGDYVIQGVEGEFYPCKPGIFDATYEAVESTDEAQQDAPLLPGQLAPGCSGDSHEVTGRCPDDGTCHHKCPEQSCFRVQFCGPLSARLWMFLGALKRQSWRGV